MTFDPRTTPLGLWPRLVHRNEIRPLLEERDRLAEDLADARRSLAALSRDVAKIRAGAGDAIGQLDHDLLRTVRDVASNAARTERKL